MIASQRVPNARPMTGSAKQSMPSRKGKDRLDCFVALLLAMTVVGARIAFNCSPMFSREPPFNPIYLVDRMPEPPHHEAYLSEVP